MGSSVIGPEALDLLWLPKKQKIFTQNVCITGIFIQKNNFRPILTRSGIWTTVLDSPYVQQAALNSETVKSIPIGVLCWPQCAQCAPKIGLCFTYQDL